jgi:hypothetical protein
VLIPFALGGMALDYSGKRASSHVFYSVLATLLLLYVLLGPVTYFYQQQSTGRGFVAFTPSRFLYDMVYCLSLFAGYALYRLQEASGLSGRTTIAIALLLACTNIPQWEDLLTPDSDRGRFEAYNWIANNTPQNSILFTADPWACYAAWRRTLRTPMPVSEPRVPSRISEKARMELLAGRSPQELDGIPLLVVFWPSDRKEGRGKTLWTNPDGWAVTDGFAVARCSGCALPTTRATVK